MKTPKILSNTDDYIIEINKRLEGKTSKEQLAELNMMIAENEERIGACHDAMLRELQEGTIHNPVTNTDYEVKKASSKHGTKGQITGMWRRKRSDVGDKKKKGLLDWILEEKCESAMNH